MAVAVVAFAGAGRMAGAMVHGLLSVGRTPETLRCLGGPEDDTGPKLAEATGIGLATTGAQLMAGADILVLACKPQQFAKLDPALVAGSKGRLVLSILAGTPLAKLTAKFPEARAVVRAMPNTPGQIGAGISVYASAAPLSAEDAAEVQAILGSLGAVLPLPEEHLDAVTALSGSGPAYLFEFAAALREGGIALGLPPEAALQLTLHTLLGSARLLVQSGASPEDLRDQVTSPGGTTAAALKVFREAEFRGLVARALAAARDRGQELAKL